MNEKEKKKLEERWTKVIDRIIFICELPYENQRRCIGKLIALNNELKGIRHKLYPDKQPK